MTGVLLGELRGDEGPRIALQYVFAEAVLKIGEELLVAENEPGIEQGGADGHVGQAEADALGDGARGVADFEAEVPQEIQHVFGDALAPGRLLVGKQEQEIDIGARREQAAPIAALGDHGHALGGGRIFRAVDVLGGEVVGQADQRVLEVGEPGRAGAAVAILLEPLPAPPSGPPRRAVSDGRPARRGAANPDLHGGAQAPRPPGAGDRSRNTGLVWARLGP